MLNRSRIKAVVPVIAALVLWGCFSKPPAPPKPPPPPPPTMIEVTISTLADVNPDARGRPSPIIIKFYELKSLTAFQAADFFSIFDRDKDILGSELTLRNEFSLAPSDRQVFTREPQAETKFIGVIAAFRDIDRAVWRSSYEIPSHRTTNVNVRLDARRMTILAEPAAGKAAAGPAAPVLSPAHPGAQTMPAKPAVPTK